MQEYYSQAEKKLLLKIARDVVTARLSGKAFSFDKLKISKKLKEKRAVFVTLTINGELRGCIGSLSPEEELFNAVVHNSSNAAFHDPRFSPLTKDELDNIKIEISVLTPMKRFDYKNVNNIIEFLNKNKPGVYIKKGYYSATYLPQVWEHFEKVEDFLSSLCEKAGLDSDAWKSGSLEVFSYNVEAFSES